MSSKRPLVGLDAAGGAMTEGGGVLGATPMVVTPVTMVVILDLLLLGLFSLFAALVDDFDVIVEDGCDDRDHIGLDHARADVLRASDADVDNALEGQVPLPHAHHVLAPALFEDAYQALDAAVDGEDVTDAGRGGGQVGEMVEGVDEREGRGAVERSSVVEGGGDADRRLVDVGDAEVDFPHDGGIVSQRLGVEVEEISDRDTAAGARRWARGEGG